MKKKRILFITGTRADYGKIKSILIAMEKTEVLEPHLYVCGMHILEEYGGTYREVLKDGFKNVHVAKELIITDSMSANLGDLVINLTRFVRENEYDMIVVHGDRTDALGGAIVGALNNIRVGHIEGGELSGTIDDSIRHSISKLSHFHFVCNDEAKKRLIQMGEDETRIFVVGSPDIDLMFSQNLPSLEEAKNKYNIQFDDYSILMFHPVTTEVSHLQNNIKNLVDVIIESKRNYIVILPNNDYGTNIIQNEYKRLDNNGHFRIFPSIRFEYFLTLMKNSDFVIGNSSAGVRETCVYGIPSIDIGTRQQARYAKHMAANIIHCSYEKEDIARAICNYEEYQIKSSYFGDGQASEKIVKILLDKNIWTLEIQKHFVDLE